MMIAHEEIVRQIEKAVYELLRLERDDFNSPQLMVVGCSTSEIHGSQIGKAGQPELGGLVAQTIMRCAEACGVQLAFQCCEHLNRALVVERKTAERYNLEIVSAVPYPSAGGSCASAAYRLMRAPVLVETVRADAGIDIGETLIGMHLRPVAIPIRLKISSIGMARVTVARTRPKLIGGSRARYELDDQ